MTNVDTMDIVVDPHAHVESLQDQNEQLVHLAQQFSAKIADSNDEQHQKHGGALEKFTVWVEALRLKLIKRIEMAQNSRPFIYNKKWTLKFFKWTKMNMCPTILRIITCNVFFRWWTIKNFFWCCALKCAEWLDTYLFSSIRSVNFTHTGGQRTRKCRCACWKRSELVELCWWFVHRHSCKNTVKMNISSTKLVAGWILRNNTCHCFVQYRLSYCKPVKKSPGQYPKMRKIKYLKLIYRVCVFSLHV